MDQENLAFAYRQQVLPLGQPVQHPFRLVHILYGHVNGAHLSHFSTMNEIVPPERWHLASPGQMHQPESCRARPILVQHDGYALATSAKTDGL